MFRRLFSCDCKEKAFVPETERHDSSRAASGSFEVLGVMKMLPSLVFVELLAKFSCSCEVHKTETRAYESPTHLSSAAYTGRSRNIGKKKRHTQKLLREALTLQD